MNVTFESARGSFPADSSLMQQPPSSLSQVLPAKHPAILYLSLRLRLHLAVNISESRLLLMQVNQAVHLFDGVFDQTQSPSQILVLLCVR